MRKGRICLVLTPPGGPWEAKRRSAQSVTARRSVIEPSTALQTFPPAYLCLPDTVDARGPTVK